MMFLEKPVNVGVNKTADPKKGGVMWVMSDAGTAKTIPFVVDKPELIKNGANFFTMRRIVKQMEKMGFTPHMVEIVTKERTYSYNVDPYRLVLNVVNPVFT